MTTKIAQFAKDQFGIELTTAQLEYIAIVAAGNDKTVLNFGRKIGITTANKVIYAWLQYGLKGELVIDHMQPRSSSDFNREANVRFMHRACNDRQFKWYQRLWRKVRRFVRNMRAKLWK